MQLPDEIQLKEELKEYEGWEDLESLAEPLGELWAANRYDGDRPGVARMAADQNDPEFRLAGSSADFVDCVTVVTAAITAAAAAIGSTAAGPVGGILSAGLGAGGGSAAARLVCRRVIRQQ